MKYFNLLPAYTYSNGILGRNLNWKYYFATEIDTKYLSTYRIQDGESLESICYDLYKDASIWWLIAMLNGFRDVIFEMPLNEDTIQKIAQDLSTTITLSLVDASNFTVGGFISGDGVEGNSGKATISSIIGNDVVVDMNVGGFVSGNGVDYRSTFVSEITTISSISSVLNESEYITNYDLLTDDNDDKRVIRIIKPEFIQKILKDIVRQT